MILISIAVILLAITDLVLTFWFGRVNKDIEDINKKIDSPTFGDEVHDKE